MASICLVVTTILSTMPVLTSGFLNSAVKFFSTLAAAAPVEEKTAFDVILKSGDAAKKIAIIKEVRAAVPGLGLAEAKALVEGAPKTVKEGVTKEEAEEIKKKIEAAGGVVEIK